MKLYFIDINQGPPGALNSIAFKRGVEPAIGIIYQIKSNGKQRGAFGHFSSIRYEAGKIYGWFIPKLRKVE